MRRTGNSPLQVDDEGQQALQDQFQQRLSEASVASGSNIANTTPKPLTTDTFREILNEQLGPIQKDIMAIKQHGISKHDLQLAINPLKNEIDDLTKRIGLLESNYTSQPVSGRTSEAS
eukprot:4803139-Pyramimonas_sp.AAC.1